MSKPDNLKKIVFVTGTRADYGKIKPLICSLQLEKLYDIKIFICGMHLDINHGSTYIAVMRDFPDICHIFNNLTRGKDASNALSECVYGFNIFLRDHQPDLVVVHGDRVEALAACVSSCLNNIIVAHIEGGEQSGTIDESIRHAISKFSHHHFVCSNDAKDVLLKFGENVDYVYNIGSSDIDFIVKKQFPSFQDACLKYDILFKDYGIVLYHPVTTDIIKTIDDCQAMVDALISSKRNYIVILPNNDLGSREIIDIYNSSLNSSSFRILPSIDFEYFLSILANSAFLVGNSSAGVREMPYIDLPSLNIGLRQQSRLNVEVDSVFHLPYPSSQDILSLLDQHWGQQFSNNFITFGDGSSSFAFSQILSSEFFWQAPLQKLLCF